MSELAVKIVQYIEPVKKDIALLRFATSFALGLVEDELNPLKQNVIELKKEIAELKLTVKRLSEASASKTTTAAPPAKRSKSSRN